MKNNLKFIGFCLLTLAASACTKDNAEDLYPPDNNNQCDTTDVTYSGVIKGILNSSCAASSGCHLGAGHTGIDLATYQGLLAVVNNGKLLPAIRHTGPKPMPEGAPKLDDCTILKIETWIGQGALDN